MQIAALFKCIPLPKQNMKNEIIQQNPQIHVSLKPM